ncbi:hypothetical protein KAR29_03780 [Aminithiophilus ramosus]|uniref:Uncharacterized protein n=1 Tax=Aminithiophilus ramosus TaxID=3029084 RepID=A0A9Q7EW73_9BACT|nr:hypothetical protein KAR29_03780 [Aminithiophilus ramosus]
MSDTDTLSKPFIPVPPRAQPILQNSVLAEEQKDKRRQFIRNRSKMEKNENQSTVDAFEPALEKVDSEHPLDPTGGRPRSFLA